MIKIEGLTKTYSRGFFKKEKLFLLGKNINMEIKRGTKGPAGASGSGKSTIGKIPDGEV